MSRSTVAALALSLLLLSGCWSRIEVNDLAVISLAALDREEGGDLRLTLQIVLPPRIPRPSGGGEAAGAGVRPTHVVSATGRTILEASHTLQLQLSRRLFWAHASVFLIGERLATHGMRPVEDLLNRFPQIRPHAFLVAVRGDALDLMSVLPELERLPAEAIRDLEQSRAGLAMTIREYTRSRGMQGKDPALPWLGVVPTVSGQVREDPGLQDFRLQGSALFAGDRLVGWMEADPTSALVLLQGRPLNGVVTVPGPKDSGLVSVMMTRTKLRREVIRLQNRPGIALHVVMEASLYDVAGPVDLLDPAAVLKVEDALRQEVAGRIREALDQARSLRVDPFGLGELIHQTHPNWWRAVRDKWREEFPSLPVFVRVDVRVRSAGVSTRPTTPGKGD